MSHIYLGAIAFGVTLLVASLLLGGKDTDHGDGHDQGHDSAPGLGWAPITSLRFWIFLLAFGGGAGYALEQLGSSATVAAIGAAGVGWTSGVLAVAVIRSLTKKSVSSAVAEAELVGATGELVLPVAPGKPGKVRIEIKGRAEDYVANVVDDSGELPTGTQVLVVAEGDQGSLLVTKHEV
jgi:membrane protein implicated in regulation of membrane protease activity